MIPDAFNFPDSVAASIEIIPVVGSTPKPVAPAVENDMLDEMLIQGTGVGTALFQNVHHPCLEEMPQSPVVCLKSIHAKGRSLT